MSALGAMHVQSEHAGYMSGGAGGAGPRSKMTPERECVSESTETPHPPEHTPLISSKAHILNKEDWNHVAELPIDGLDQLAAGPGRRVPARNGPHGLAAGQVSG